MKANVMSDEKILEIKDFKKVDGEVVQVSGKKKRKSKSKSQPKDSNKNTKQHTMDFGDMEFVFIADDLTLEEQFAILLEENEFLRTELIKEISGRETMEKLLNKVLKQNKNKKEDV